MKMTDLDISNIDKLQIKAIKELSEKIKDIENMVQSRLSIWFPVLGLLQSSNRPCRNHPFQSPAVSKHAANLADQKHWAVADSAGSPDSVGRQGRPLDLL